MKALSYSQFQGPITIDRLPDPKANPGSVILKVLATGLCRSDWHGWMGHDPDIKTFPHVPGHELAGMVVEVGAKVKNFQLGDRVTVPFVCACGTCSQCVSENHQICDYQTQPGFTHWGSFAEYVAINNADVNLVRLPEGISSETAAILGCRFATSFRAVIDQGKIKPGQFLVVHGCGGVGLSAVMIGKAMGAEVIAVDILDKNLEIAKEIGASLTINAASNQSVVEEIKDFTEGGAHVSLDALGNRNTCTNSILGLRKRGKHIQVGLMAGEHSMPPIPMSEVISNELEIIGSHGMQAFRYTEMLDLIIQGKMKPSRLISRTINLQQAKMELPKMDQFQNFGISVIDQF